MKRRGEVTLYTHTHTRSSGMKRRGEGTDCIRMLTYAVRLPA